VTQFTQLISADTAAGQGAEVHRFAHPAMGAVFEVFIAGKPNEYAGHAAGAAFEELDRLEAELSRFIPASDVSHVNAVGAQGPVRVGLDTFACLAAAARVAADTGGAFDVTIGRLLELWRPTDGSPPAPSAQALAEARDCTGMHLVTLDEACHAVGLARDGVRIDLGGIGKGYAVDRMMDLVAEWSVAQALIHGGQSTLLARGRPPDKDGWTVALSDPAGKTLAAVCLRDRALSGSGSPPGGRHIVDPRTGRLAEANLGAWALTPQAALADALSTAFLVMSPEEVEAYCGGHPDVAAMVLTAEKGGGKVRRFGKWDTTS